MLRMTDIALQFGWSRPWDGHRYAEYDPRVWIMNMSNDDVTIETVRERMQHVRREMTDEVDQLVSSARDLTDWRQYVRAYPWLSVAMAAAVGYFVVPKQTGRVRFCDADREAITQIEQLARRESEVPVGKRIRQAVVKAAALTAMRAVLGYVGQRLAQPSMRGDLDQPV